MKTSMTAPATGLSYAGSGLAYGSSAGTPELVLPNVPRHGRGLPVAGLFGSDAPPPRGAPV